MILFLGFGGVLHANNVDFESRFARLPLLATWLEEWPEVDVVLTSTWRRSNLQSHLIDLLGPTVGVRVVGCTPWSGSRESPVLIFGQRQWEAEAWMASSWDPGSAWVALDDTPDLFEHECKHLVACDGRQGLAATPGVVSIKFASGEHISCANPGTAGWHVCG